MQRSHLYTILIVSLLVLEPIQTVFCRFGGMQKSKMAAENKNDMFSHDVASSMHFADLTRETSETLYCPPTQPPPPPPPLPGSGTFTNSLNFLCFTKFFAGCFQFYPCSWWGLRRRSWFTTPSKLNYHNPVTDRPLAKLMT